MKNLIACVVVAGLVWPAAAQLLVTGTVKDETGAVLSGVRVQEKGTVHQVTTDGNGTFTIAISRQYALLEFWLAGWEPQILPAAQNMEVSLRRAQPIVLTRPPEHEIVPHLHEDVLMEQIQTSPMHKSNRAEGTYHPHHWQPPHQYWKAPQDSEEYATTAETGFKRLEDAPLSTFSIDVDAASYSNVRRFLMNGQLPPVDAIRIEEMINYFDYAYATPKGKDPFAIHTHLMAAPWNQQHLLARVALKGKELDVSELPPSNLVFLIDVSGSMDSPNKLPLLKSSLKLLVNQMREKDKVAIVVYAGAAGTVLEPTAGNERQKIIAALDKLSAGGSTAGGAGIRLAYKLAEDHFIKGGNNRVILATDGDFNVGESSNEALEKLIEDRRKSGVFLTILGYGMGNYKDAKMELLADKGNGNYAYIDNMTEAYKVLVSEFGGTLYTIAKDVKIQVEFNPAYVQAYRLIGYENRRLKDEDFNNDKKDAGELGSGHTVTALYEIVLTGIHCTYPGSIDKLKYQQEKPKLAGVENGELFTVKFRYKEPDGDVSKLIIKTMGNKMPAKVDTELQWAASVAGFGMLLSKSGYAYDLTFDKLLTLANAAKGIDEKGYRGEMIKLVQLASAMQVN